MSKRTTFLTRRVAERGEDIEHLLTVIQVALDALDDGDDVGVRLILRSTLRKHNRVTWQENAE